MNTTATRLSDQQRELIGYLVDGRWHGAGELYSRMVNWRTRMSELNHIYPDRFVYRWRTHLVAGKRVTSKDWLDTKWGGVEHSRIVTHLKRIQATVRCYAGHERDVVAVGPGAVYGYVTHGEVVYYSLEKLTERVWERYVDPFREGE